MQFEWQGVFPALTTKFTEDGQLDLNLFGQNLAVQLDAGVRGVILGGTLGEASVLTATEKEELTRFTVARIAEWYPGENLPVIVNIAEGSTASAIQQAEMARSWGANGLMVLPPMRYKSDHRETVNWFRTIANSTDLPIMVYNNPVDYKVEVTLDMFDELQYVPNIQAVKESTRDVTNVTRMINRYGERFKILCGVDTLAMEELALGADGWVAGLVCAYPHETVQLYEAMQRENLSLARAIYRWFTPLLELDIHPKLVQYIKLAESENQLGSEWVRAPRLVLEGEERERILSIIHQQEKTRHMIPGKTNRKAPSKSV